MSEQTCPRCHGTGHRLLVVDLIRDEDHVIDAGELCGLCNGSGTVPTYGRSPLWGAYHG